MANISKLRRHTAPDGEWVTINEEDEPFQVLVRPPGPKYHDREYELREAAARLLNRNRVRSRPYTPETLPPSEANAAMAQAVVDHIILGVAGLSDDDGEAVTLDQLKALILDPDYVSILIMVYSAASVLATQSAEAKESATGNSPPVSAGN